jgi:hypothetical protein
MGIYFRFNKIIVLLFTLSKKLFGDYAYFITPKFLLW